LNQVGRLSVSEIPLPFKRGELALSLSMGILPPQAGFCILFKYIVELNGRTTIVKKVEEEQLTLTFFIF